jgi:hypothetical protein
MFGLASISWGSFLLATGLLCVLFNIGVWLYFKFGSQGPSGQKEQARHDEFPNANDNLHRKINLTNNRSLKQHQKFHSFLIPKLCKNNKAIIDFSHTFFYTFDTYIFLCYFFEVYFNGIR